MFCLSLSASSSNNLSVFLWFVVVPLHKLPPPTFIIIFPAKPKVRWWRGDWGECSEWRAWGQSP